MQSGSRADEVALPTYLIVRCDMTKILTDAIARDILSGRRTVAIAPACFACCHCVEENNPMSVLADAIVMTVSPSREPSAGSGDGSPFRFNRHWYRWRWNGAQL